MAIQGVAMAVQVRTCTETEPRQSGVVDGGGNERDVMFYAFGSDSVGARVRDLVILKTHVTPGLSRIVHRDKQAGVTDG